VRTGKVKQFESGTFLQRAHTPAQRAMTLADDNRLLTIHSQTVICDRDRAAEDWRAGERHLRPLHDAGAAWVRGSMFQERQRLLSCGVV